MVLCTKVYGTELKNSNRSGRQWKADTKGELKIQEITADPLSDEAMEEESEAQKH